MSQEYPYLFEAGTEHGPIWLLSTEKELRTATREEIALWRLLVTAREERERLRAVVEAARAEAQAREAMLSVVPIGAYTRNDAALMTAWIDAASVLDAALDALEGKGEA